MRPKRLRRISVFSIQLEGEGSSFTLFIIHAQPRAAFEPRVAVRIALVPLGSETEWEKPSAE